MNSTQHDCKLLLEGKGYYTSLIHRQEASIKREKQKNNNTPEKQEVDGGTDKSHYL